MTKEKAIDIWNEYHVIQGNAYDALEKLDNFMRSTDFENMKKSIRELKLDEDNYWFHDTFPDYLEQLHDAMGY